MARPSTPERVIENRLRRVLARRGYTLLKSRRRDPDAPDYQRFAVGVADGADVLPVAGTDAHGRPTWTRAEMDARLPEFTAARRPALRAAARRGNPAVQTGKDSSR